MSWGLRQPGTAPAPGRRLSWLPSPTPSSWAGPAGVHLLPIGVASTAFHKREEEPSREFVMSKPLTRSHAYPMVMPNHSWCREAPNNGGSSGTVSESKERIQGALMPTNTGPTLRWEHKVELWKHPKAGTLFTLLLFSLFFSPSFFSKLDCHACQHALPRHHALCPKVYYHQPPEAPCLCLLPQYSLYMQGLS